MLEIIYQDKYIICINKPCGILVHRTPLAVNETEFVVQKLRDQTGLYIYPVHRLDRPTSGVLIFALDSQTASILSRMLISSEVTKTYVALVRGWFPGEIDLNYPVKNERGTIKDAITRFKCLKNYSIDIPVGAFPSARYSLVKCWPQTGRWHQIRQHLAHLRYYIVNDRVHGDGKHNNIFKHKLGIEPLFLHAAELVLKHPYTGEIMKFEASFPDHWQQFINISKEENINEQNNPI